MWSWFTSPRWNFTQLSIANLAVILALLIVISAIYGMILMEGEDLL